MLSETGDMFLRSGASGAVEGSSKVNSSKRFLAGAQNDRD
jgi:hypothetical protein